MNKIFILFKEYFNVSFGFDLFWQILKLMFGVWIILDIGTYLIKSLFKNWGWM